MIDWQPIHTAPFDAEEPFLIWVPKWRCGISALPMDVIYDEDGNTPIGWDGEPNFTITGPGGGDYGLGPDAEPSHWALITPPEDQ